MSDVGKGLGIVSGMRGLSGVRGYDWYKARLVKNQEAIRGTQIAVTPASNGGTICGRMLDGTVNVGGLGGIPINPGTIDVGDLQGGAYVAPTFQANSFSATTQANVQGMLQDIITNIIVTNVPQDGSVAKVLWLVRRTGTTVWTPWAETPLNGLPEPPVNQNLSFAYGQLSNGIGYDFGLAYVSIRGETGATAAFATNYVAPNSGLSIPSNYLVNNRAWTPALTGVGTQVGASTNGLSASIILNLTITNQPTDGSLSRISFFYRVSGTTDWSFYGSMPAVGLGLTNPPTSGAYIFTYADLTNGVGYDFAIACEDAQGGETAIEYVTNITAQAIVLGSPQLSSMPNMNAPNVSNIVIGPAHVNTSSFDEPISFNVDSVGTSQSTWLKDVELVYCAHGTASWAHAGSLGVKQATGGAGASYNGVVPGLSGNDIYDFGVRYVDLQGNKSNVASLGSNPFTSTPTSAPAPNLVPDSNFYHSTSSSDPYWQFYWIDGLSFFIGTGNTDPTLGPTGINYLGVRQAFSGKNCTGLSEAITVVPGSQYTVSAYIDARTCSGSAPYVAIVSTNIGTEYVRASQINGQHGIVSNTWTCPAGVTQVSVYLASNACTVSGSILVLAQPMLQEGKLGPYQPGPDSTANPVPTNPPPTTGPPGDGGTGGGGTGSGGGGGSPQPPGGRTRYVVGGVQRLATTAWQLQLHFDSTADSNGATLTSGLITARHLAGGLSTDVAPLFQNDGTNTTLVHGRSSTAVQARIGSDKTLHVDSATGPVSGNLPQANHDPAVLSGSVTGIVKNLVPDSEITFGLGNGYWSTTSGIGITPNYGGAGGSCFYYTGNGAASGFHSATSASIYLQSGTTYNLSGYINAVHVTSGTLYWGLFDQGITTNYASINQTPGTYSRLNVDFTVPANGLYTLICDTGNCTILNGNLVIWSEPQITLGSGVVSYRPSLGTGAWNQNYWPYGIHHPAVTNNLDSSGNVKASTMLKTYIPNSLGNLSANFKVNTYSSASGSLAMWFTSVGNSSSPGGSQYPSWTYPDNSGSIFPGHLNGYAAVNGTSSSSPKFAWSNLGSGGVYVGVVYNIASDQFTVTYGPSTTPPTDAQYAAAIGDGQIAAVIATATTSSIVPTGGGGGYNPNPGGPNHVRY